MIRTLRHCLTLFLCLQVPVVTLYGCGPSASPDEYRVESVRLNKENLSLEVGESAQVKARPIPAAAHQPSFQWETSNPAVATVSAGLVFAVGEGEAVITASYQDMSASLTVSVKAMELGDRALLYSVRPSSLKPEDAKLLQIGSAGNLAEDGLVVSRAGQIASLDRYYSLGERVAEYIVNLSSDTKAVFQSAVGDFKAYVDVPNRKISINTTPEIVVSAPFLKGGRDCRLEIYHIYNQARVVITDVATGESAALSATHDGTGGCGKGTLQEGFSVGMQWAGYAFGLVSGGSFVVKRISVASLKQSVKLLIYGDSISQPEGYFPAATFPDSWTQRIISALDGNAMSSGRGGCTISDVLRSIQNELPYIECDYVMVTIGTNGGNTEENLTQLTNYIISQGRIPIMNNIPSNESGTQVSENAIIEKVRSKLGIKGTLFDLATSLDGDGRTVDRSLMFWEDYTGSYGWQIYHHPNELGGGRMFERTKVDIPEIYQ